MWKRACSLWKKCTLYIVFETFQDFLRVTIELNKTYGSRGKQIGVGTKKAKETMSSNLKVSLHTNFGYVT